MKHGRKEFGGRVTIPASQLEVGDIIETPFHTIGVVTEKSRGFYAYTHGAMLDVGQHYGKGARVTLPLGLLA